ncbi:hypothetical protein HBI79_169700 [Parastagonospora nodorum]|nr:hypothetical protein HBI79_169700 [Parastagonospora nodorum]KAH5410086.1 hypothetical protein HBI47_165530 [Parastagonospora nodorum]
MLVIALISLPPSSTVDVTIAHLEILLKATNTPFTIGTKVQDPSIIQITTQYPSLPSTSALSSHPPYTSLVSSLTPYNPSITTVTLDTSILPAPLVEFVKSDFPTPLSPSRQAQIESDFARFESLYRGRGSMADVGEISLSMGWSEPHPNAQGVAVKSWVVARGWQGMPFFEKAVASEEFKGCIGILMGWGAEFELWHVGTKVAAGEV